MWVRAVIRGAERRRRRMVPRAARDAEPRAPAFLTADARSRRAFARSGRATDRVIWLSRPNMESALASISVWLRSRVMLARSAAIQKLQSATESRAGWL